LITTITNLIPEATSELIITGHLLNALMPQEYSLEIQGCAQAVGVDYGWITLLNLGYELSDACTSIVAQTEDGKIYHARNLDFGEGLGFTNTLKDLTIQVEYQKAGQTFFHGTTFPGYVGLLSGMKPGAFSVTIDTRFYPNGIWEIFLEVVAAMTEKNATMVSFLSRNVFQRESDWDAAVENLSTGTLIADVYYIVAGATANQGAVISRNRLNATDVWKLDAPSRWFEVETNYDHWEQPPWWDNRIDPANHAMNEMGRSKLSLDGMFKVLSVKPVLNLLTTYTILTCPAENTYSTVKRYCQYPCVD